MENCKLGDYHNGLCLTKCGSDTIATPCSKEGCFCWQHTPDLPTRLRALAEEMRGIDTRRLGWLEYRIDPKEIARNLKRIATELENNQD